MLKTKFTVPRISRNIVPRKKAEEKLKNLQDIKLAIICAPAGYGKTTTVASYLQKENIRHAWLSVDETDNDPVRFWRYMTEAAAACMGDRTLKQITINAELIASNITTDLFINALGCIPQDAVLVLDDYHLIHDETIQKSIGYFAKYMPDNIRMVILSRNEPEGELLKLSSREMTVRLGIMDLSFNSDETSELFLQRNIRLTHDQAVTLKKYTEGWVAGLIAASFSIGEDDDIQKAVDQISGKNRHIDNILGNDVFNAWDEQIQQFLVSTSFLDRLSGPLCRDVTGNADSQEILETLSVSNGFVIPLDHENGWFRYHHLFQEYLLGRFEKKGIIVQRSLYSLAGQWYQQNNFTSDAIERLIKSCEYEKAFPLILETYISLTQDGEFATWRRWMDAMPESLCESDVRACTGYSWVLSMENRLDQANIWADKAQKCFDRIKTNLDQNEQDYLETNIVATYANLAILQMDSAKVVQYYRKISDYKIHTPIIIGEMNSGEPCLLNTAYGFKGRLHKIEEAYGAFVENLPLVIGDFSSYFVIALAECQYEHDDLKAVYTTLVANMGRITRLKNPGVIVPCFIVLAKQKRAEGDMQGALRIIESGKDFIAKSNTVWRYFFDIFAASLYLSAGDIKSASEHMALSRIGIYDTLSPSREFEYLVYAKYLMLTENIDDSLILLNRLEDFAQREDRLKSRIEALCLTATCHHVRKDDASAMPVLNKALELGKEDGYLRTFVDKGTLMTQMLEKYRSWAKNTGTSTFAQYAREILKVSKQNLQTLIAFRPGSVPETAAVKNHLSKRESEVLSLLVTEYTNQQIADALFITVRTVKHHNACIFEKLGVKNRLEAIIRARELGLAE